MSTKPQLTICPTVAAMTADPNGFNLDDLAAHVKDCPTCQAITAALTKPVIDAITTWPPEPKDDEP